MIDWQARILLQHTAQERRNTALVRHVSSVLEERLSFLKRDFSEVCKIWSPEEKSPLTPGPFDLIYHVLGLHWSDSLATTLSHIKQALKPGGLFIGALLGEHALSELKAVFTHVEEKRLGYVSPRFLPLPSAGHVTGLLQEAGFKDPVVDREMITQSYTSLAECYKDLRHMGETNSLKGRLQGLTTPRFMQECEDLYRKQFSTDEGKIYATFEVLYLIAWR